MSFEIITLSSANQFDIFIQAGNMPGTSQLPIVKNCLFSRELETRGTGRLTARAQGRDNCSAIWRVASHKAMTTG